MFGDIITIHHHSYSNNT